MSQSSKPDRGGAGEAARSKSDRARLTAVGILATVAIVFAVVNFDEVKVHLLFGTVTMPLIIVIVACLGIGYAIGAALSRRKRSGKRGA